MKSSKRVCVFVDGENLRQNIVELFPKPIFHKEDYLPKTKWGDVFDWVVREVLGPNTERVRTYWYVVQNVDFAPRELKEICKSRISLLKVLKKNEEWKALFEKAKDFNEEEQVLRDFANFLREGKSIMEGRFNGWTSIQNDIAQNCEAVEFRRAGAIRYDLSLRGFGSEKAVDVKLATDLILLKDIYDVAIIVSGDQDYVPAVDAIKNFGKTVVNVGFLTSTDKLLPGGARRLGQATDSSFNISHSDLKKQLGL